MNGSEMDKAKGEYERQAMADVSGRLMRQKDSDRLDRLAAACFPAVYAGWTPGERPLSYTPMAQASVDCALALRIAVDAALLP